MKLGQPSQPLPKLSMMRFWDRWAILETVVMAKNLWQTLLRPDAEEKEDMDRAEVGRILGYPGEDAFWGLLDLLLRKMDRVSSL